MTPDPEVGARPAPVRSARSEEESHPGQIHRFVAAERSLHWALAAPFVLL